ncbi:MAG: serine/threonine protein kinase [Holophagales bacterium]|nr:MAG: serine/threonine protein kinase [Holophagales bacterium]
MNPSAGEPRSAAWEELFDDLVERPDAERQARLAEIAARDPALGARLARLLAAEAQAGEFLDQPLSDSLVEAVEDPAREESEGEIAVAPSSRFTAADTATSATTPGEEASPIDEQLSLGPGTRLGPWRVVKPIGRGGMGEVYLAERDDGAFSQRVAIKVVRHGGSAHGIVRRFLRERQILANLDHPNIARLLDGGTAEDGRPFFVLEWVDGEPITDYCAARHLPLEGRLRLLATVCDAVASAHRRLVVHRDLKPANILVTDDGTAKLLDFGIAKLLEDEPGESATLTRLEGRALTPAYAAPEQILGQPVTVASDIYALGVILYELVTGTLPHRRESRSLDVLAGALGQETVERPSLALRRRADGESAAATERPLPPIAVRRVVGDLDLIVLKALHREPGRRYRSAAALADDLARFLQKRPVAARPDELAYRVRRFVDRHRWAVVASAVAGVALFAGLGVAIWQARAARAQAQRADLASARAERVKSFLVSIFRESDPQGSSGTEPTAREVLARGAERLDVELVADPETHADLLEAIAKIETSLGALDPALVHARRALELRAALPVRDDAQLARGEVVLGEALMSHGDRLEAQKAFEAALPRLIAAYGEQSEAVAETRGRLGASLTNPEDTIRAVTLLEQALATLESLQGADSLAVAAARQELGIAYEMVGRYPESETAYRASLSAFERISGAGHPRVAEAQANLAGLLDRLSRPQEARPLFAAAIATQRARLGPRHERLAETLFSYGVLLLGGQEHAAAEAALREALDIFGPDRFDSAHCLRYLGLSAAGQERYAEAADLYARAAEIYSRTLGPGNVQQQRALANLGWAHARMGKVGEGLAELAGAVAAIERAAGGESYEVRLPLKQLGEVQTTAGRAAAAVATLERVRALEVKLFGTRDHREVAGSELLLARALLARAGPGDRAAARRCLDAALDIFARVRPHDVLRADALLESGRMALADGDRPRARSDLAAAVPLLAEKRGARHASTREAERLLRRAGGPPR